MCEDTCCSARLKIDILWYFRKQVKLPSLHCWHDITDCLPASPKKLLPYCAQKEGENEGETEGASVGDCMPPPPPRPLSFPAQSTPPSPYTPFPSITQPSLPSLLPSIFPAEAATLQLTVSVLYRQRHKLVRRFVLEMYRIHIFFVCVIQANCVPNSAEHTDERQNLCSFFDDQTWLNEQCMQTSYEFQHGTRSVVHYSTVDLA